MGNSKSSPTGTSFKETKRYRDVENQGDDIPTIPYLKQKMVKEFIEDTVKNSIYLTNFKRAYRGYLRKKPNMNQTGTMYRIHDFSLKNANDLGLPKDSYNELIEKCLRKLAPELNDEVIDFLTDRGKIRPGDSAERKIEISEANIGYIFQQMVDSLMEQVGKKLYEKYSRGADFEASDTEIDEETRRRMEKEKQQRLKAAAEARVRQAAEFQKDAEAAERRAAEAQDAAKARQAEHDEMVRAREEAEVAGLLAADGDGDGDL